MSLVVNNNMMAANTARNLNAHYGRLATSTQRLSSGLRVNSAADDAAGLAIRELQRADIAALQQGARNANDAISMIQVADGSLGIIDEKLIRMKELAEQAATGTYDSTQRLMIESEYQAMASEITRIANATDFNGTKLLDGTLAGDHDGSGLISEGKMKIHFGTGNDSAEDYYYVEIGECTSEALGLGNNSTWQDVQRRGVEAFKDSLRKQIKEDKTLSDEDKGKLLSQIDAMADSLEEAINMATSPAKAYELWRMSDGEKDHVATDAEIYAQYLEDGGAKATADEALAENSTNWQNAVTALSATIFTAYQALGGAEDDATDAANNDADLWNQAIEASKDAIYTDYLTNQLKLQPNAADAKANDAQKWEKAQKDAQEAASDPDEGFLVGGKSWVGNSPLMSEFLAAGAKNAAAVAGGEIWEAYAASYGAATTVAAAKANSTTWYQAVTNMGLDDATYAQYLEDGGAKATADEALAENSTNWQSAVTALSATIFTAYQALGGAEADATDAANNDADLWNQAIEASKDAIYTDYLTNQLNLQPNAADAKANDAQKWAAAANKVLAANGFTDDDVYGQYMKDLGAQPNAEAAQANDADKWQAAVDASSLTDDQKADAKALSEFWNSLRTTEKQKLLYAFGQATLYNLAYAKADTNPPDFGLDMPGLDLAAAAGLTGESGERANEILTKALKDMQAKVGHMDFAGFTVETQEDAQHALDAINEAIISKDKIRAHLGAAQNRLENTVSNLNIQAENLQAAESRISDVDVATEMTEFVRNQILTQSAVAMLSQANSLPQMAMQLIGG